MGEVSHGGHDMDTHRDRPQIGMATSDAMDTHRDRRKIGMATSDAMDTHRDRPQIGMATSDAMNTHRDRRKIGMATSDAMDTHRDRPKISMVTSDVVLSTCEDSVSLGRMCASSGNIGTDTTDTGGNSILADTSQDDKRRAEGTDESRTPAGSNTCTAIANGREDGDEVLSRIAFNNNNKTDDGIFSDTNIVGAATAAEPQSEASGKNDDISMSIPSHDRSPEHGTDNQCTKEESFEDVPLEIQTVQHDVCDVTEGMRDDDENAGILNNKQLLSSVDMDGGKENGTVGSKEYPREAGRYDAEVDGSVTLQETPSVTNENGQRLSGETGRDSSHVFVEWDSMDPLQQPIRSSARIKYSSLAVCEQYIALGANTGALYIFNTHSLHYVSMVQGDKEGPVVQCAFSPDGNMLGYATSKGHVTILELNITKRGKPHKTRMSTDHLSADVAALCWNSQGTKLFIGDGRGVVTAVSPKDLLAMPSEVIMKLEEPVVQIDVHGDKILVSTLNRAYLGNTAKHQFSQIGKKPREGAYGGCFYKLAHMREPLLYCARPGSRLWEVDCGGNVQNTHQFKSLLDTPPLPVVHAVAGEEVCVDALTCTSPGQQALAFSRLHMLGHKYLLGVTDDGLYLFDPVTVTVVLWTRLLTSDVSQVRCQKQDLYLLHSDSTVQKITLSSVPKLISQAFQKGLTKLCSDLMLTFQPVLMRSSSWRHVPVTMVMKMSSLLEAAGQREASNKIYSLVRSMVREVETSGKGEEASEALEGHIYSRLDSGIYVIKRHSEDIGEHEDNNTENNTEALLERIIQFHGQRVTDSQYAEDTGSVDSFSSGELNVEEVKKLRKIKDRAKTKLLGIKDKLKKTLITVVTENPLASSSSRAPPNEAHSNEDRSSDNLEMDDVPSTGTGGSSDRMGRMGGGTRTGANPDELSDSVNDSSLRALDRQASLESLVSLDQSSEGGATGSSSSRRGSLTSGSVSSGDLVSSGQDTVEPEPIYAKTYLVGHPQGRKKRAKYIDLCLVETNNVQNSDKKPQPGTAACEGCSDGETVGRSSPEALPSSSPLSEPPLSADGSLVDDTPLGCDAGQAPNSAWSAPLAARQENGNSYCEDGVSARTSESHLRHTGSDQSPQDLDDMSGYIVDELLEEVCDRTEIRLCLLEVLLETGRPERTLRCQCGAPRPGAHKASWQREELITGVLHHRDIQKQARLLTQQNGYWRGRLSLAKQHQRDREQLAAWVLQLNDMALISSQCMWGYLPATEEEWLQLFRLKSLQHRPSHTGDRTSTPIYSRLTQEATSHSQSAVGDDVGHVASSTQSRQNSCDGDVNDTDICKPASNMNHSGSIRAVSDFNMNGSGQSTDGAVDESQDADDVTGHVTRPTAATDDCCEKEATVLDSSGSGVASPISSFPFSDCDNLKNAQDSDVDLKKLFCLNCGELLSMSIDEETSQEHQGQGHDLSSKARSSGDELSGNSTLSLDKPLDNVKDYTEASAQFTGVVMTGTCDFLTRSCDLSGPITLDKLAMCVMMHCGATSALAMLGKTETPEGALSLEFYQKCALNEILDSTKSVVVSMLSKKQSICDGQLPVVPVEVSTLAELERQGASEKVTSLLLKEIKPLMRNEAEFHWGIPVNLALPCPFCGVKLTDDISVTEAGAIFYACGHGFHKFCCSEEDVCLVCLTAAHLPE